MRFKLAQNVSPDGSRNIPCYLFVSSQDNPELSEIGGRVTGFRWIDLDSQNSFQSFVFYPPVLEHLLELLNDSSYNGIELLTPGWQD